MYAFYKHEPIFLVIEHDGSTINMTKFITEEKYWQHQALELMDKYTNVIKKELDELFTGLKKELDLAYTYEGTEFEMLVWEQTLKIPYGETITYNQLAKEIEHPDAARAVGNALHKNPLPLIIPCHRIIGSDGALHGFAGGTEVKQWLLNHEKKTTGKR